MPQCQQGRHQEGHHRGGCDDAPAPEEVHEGRDRLRRLLHPGGRGARRLGGDFEGLGQGRERGYLPALRMQPPRALGHHPREAGAILRGRAPRGGQGRGLRALQAHRRLHLGQPLERPYLARGPGSDPGHERPLPREHPEDGDLLGDPALRWRRHLARRAHRHRPHGEEVRPLDEGHRGTAPRHVRSPVAPVAGHLEGPRGGRSGVRPRLRQGIADREELRRQHLVPLRAARLREHGRHVGGPVQGPSRSAQDQNGRLRLPPRVRGGARQGPRPHRDGAGLQHVRLRQRRGQTEACGAPRFWHRRGDMLEVCRPLPHVLHHHGEAFAAHSSMA
mmetsp:Transcript_104219/g.299961  ORF Transcript_104219/g.299961 Transcript_104219/m.299961 type:complete len:333 (+) Transcript_104219:1486-2484(+)